MNGSLTNERAATTVDRIQTHLKQKTEKSFVSRRILRRIPAKLSSKPDYIPPAPLPPRIIYSGFEITSKRNCIQLGAPAAGPAPLERHREKRRA